MSSALAVSIGNTRTQIGRIVDGTVQEYATVSSDTPTEARVIRHPSDIHTDSSPSCLFAPSTKKSRLV